MKFSYFSYFYPHSPLLFPSSHMGNHISFQYVSLFLICSYKICVILYICIFFFHITSSELAEIHILIWRMKKQTLRVCTCLNFPILKSGNVPQGLSVSSSVSSNDLVSPNYNRPPHILPQAYPRPCHYRQLLHCHLSFKAPLSVPLLSFQLTPSHFPAPTIFRPCRPILFPAPPIS